MPVSTRGGCTPSFFADAGEIHDQLGYRHEAVVPSDGQPAEVPSPEVGSVCRVHASGRSDATRSLEDCLLRSLLGLLSRLPSDRIPKPVTPLRQALDDLKPALVILKGTPQGVDGDLDSFFRVG